MPENHPKAAPLITPLYAPARGARDIDARQGGVLLPRAHPQPHPAALYPLPWEARKITNPLHAPLWMEFSPDFLADVIYSALQKNSRLYKQAIGALDALRQQAADKTGKQGETDPRPANRQY